jgi:hypothetical protein
MFCRAVFYARSFQAGTAEHVRRKISTILLYSHKPSFSTLFQNLNSQFAAAPATSFFEYLSRSYPNHSQFSFQKEIGSVNGMGGDLAGRGQGVSIFLPMAKNRWVFIFKIVLTNLGGPSILKPQ